jgi:uncharacterized protein YfdQ (DUF2303 family)
MRLSKIIFIVLLGMAFIFNGCETTDSITGGDDPGSGGDLEHSGTISKDETWSKDKIHIIDGYLTIENATLTIEPGTIVKFMQSSRIVVDEAGGLIADGTSETIKFTGNVEQNGYWYFIEFRSTANNTDCKLINCIIEYGGGYADYSASLTIYNNATVKNCTIKNSKSSGVYIDEDAAPVFTDNTITGCDKSPVKAYLRSANYIGYGSYTGNSLDYIYLSADEVKKNSTMKKQDVPYVIDGYASVSNATLTIEAGTTVKFDANSRLYIDENGGMVAQGTATDMITFSGKIEQKGYWYFIYFESTAASANSIMDFCKVEYGGGYADYSASVVVNNNATITNSIIQNSNSKGIHFDDEARPVFHDNTVTLNESFPVEAYMSNVSFIGTGDYTGNASGHDYLFINDATYKLVGTLLKQNVPYLFDGYCSIENGTLTVEAGTEIDFNASARLYVGTNGGFIADGTQEMIKISGYIKQKGYWYFIKFAEDSDNNNCLINNCTVEYGGGYADYTGILEVQNGGTVTNNTIQHSAGWGLVYYSAKNPVISGNTYDDCDTGNIKDNS